MAAAAKSGVIFFKGLQSGTTYQKAIHNTDLINVLVRWDNGSGTPAAATGSDFCTFSEPVQLYDAALVTGITDEKNMRVMADYSPTPYTINWDAYVNTLANRPIMNIPFKAGTRISLMQIP